jgi:HAD superfamily, subfamily IIIB (Acid phosphatase)
VSGDGSGYGEPMTRLFGLLIVAALTLGPSSVAVEASAAPPAVSDGAHARTVPTRAEWLADVKAAMEGSRGYVKERVASASSGEKLAVNFDIDNTVLASYYDGGGPIPLMIRFSRLLTRLGVAMVFNTGRATDQRARTIKQLTRAGFPVAALCLRNKGETLPAGKQRCRDGFIAAGYTLIANVGNNDTDFMGNGYERAYRLPNYGVLG